MSLRDRGPEDYVYDTVHGSSEVPLDKASPLALADVCLLTFGIHKAKKLTRSITALQGHPTQGSSWSPGSEAMFSPAFPPVPATQAFQR